MKRAQQERVDDAEYGYGGSDAEPQAKDGAGKDSVAAECAHCVAGVLKQGIEGGESACFVLAPLGGGYDSEAEESLAARFFGRHAAEDVVVGGFVYVGRDLRFEILVEAVAAQDRRHWIRKTHRYPPSFVASSECRGRDPGYQVVEPVPPRHFFRIHAAGLWPRVSAGP